MSTLNLNAPPPAYHSPVLRPYMPAHSRARAAVILLVINAAVNVLSAGAAALGLLFPISETEEISDPIVLMVALLQMGVGLIQIVLYIATIVVFLMWMYRAYENLPSFGVPRSDIKYSSGWAIGSFFIPFVALVVPYRAMKELWNKSVPHTNRMFGDLSPPAFFPLWWGAWLLSNFANQVHLRLEFQDAIAPQTSYTLGIVTAFIDIVAAVLAVMVVREIDKQQTESARLIPTQQLNPQPPSPPVFESPLSVEQA